MEIITSHNALDFDGLASIIAASKLYPGAVKVFSGTVSKNIKSFMALYKDSLVIKSPKEIDMKQVKRIIVVDTASAKRLGQLKKLCDVDGMDFHIYDHHPENADNLRGSVYEIHQVGAATTILLEKIIEQNIRISPFEATILALGIYDDTGSLLYPSTTYRDAYVAAYLLKCGANLEVVANFMERSFSDEQRLVLQGLLDTAEHHIVNKLDIIIAIHEREDFVPGLDLVTYRLLEVENADVAFSLVLMEGKVNVIGRGKSNSIKINEVLSSLGGRGHEKAASAVVKGKTCSEVMNSLLDIISKQAQPMLMAKNIMSTPVKTVSPGISIEEAGKIMLRYGHTGMPVVEGEQIVGVISRRDVDKANLHNLGHAPVKGFMTTRVVSASPDSSVNEIQKIMVQHDIGRIPIVENSRPIGIVSRTDILRTLHGEDAPEDHEILCSFGDDSVENYAELMQTRLPARILHILQTAGQVAEESASTVYCVGGFVRDLLLQVANFDLDLVVEGNGEQLARRLAEELHGTIRVHDRFGTAVVKLDNEIKIDVATARTEYYEFPAALPKVERASIREDMYRRDFTINTMALCLNPDRFGELIDYFGGRKDLENGNIRILYNLSFVEDPTRILRAIRFEQRYEFTIEADTFRFAQEAIERRLLGRLSYKRTMNELILILNEKDPVPALKRMLETGVWKYILPEVELEEEDFINIRRIPVILAWWNERYYGTNVRAWLVYIVFILSRLSESEISGVLERYNLDKYSVNCIEESLNIPSIVELVNQGEHVDPSDLDNLLGGLANENIIYLLLGVKTEKTWEHIVRYLDVKERVRLDINGNHLIELGLKPGLHFKQILDELYRLKLDGIITSREEEIQMVKSWIQEGRF